ncbi:putative carboxypeptidase C [Helianthus annuus]|uniref:Carboxypeptidase C n=1 Tax=Helianthus annuus TaxID=4232 RepID=A0A9K3NAG2_HELAN|nr:putative carboxypeptidase C [Helianthus annuus]
MLACWPDQILYISSLLIFHCFRWLFVIEDGIKGLPCFQVAMLRVTAFRHVSNNDSHVFLYALRSLFMPRRISALLEDKIQLLVYAGEYDLICNWLGNSRWVHVMSWSDQKDFISASNVSFIVDGKETGILKNHGPLTLYIVSRACF